MRRLCLKLPGTLVQQSRSSPFCRLSFPTQLPEKHRSRLKGTFDTPSSFLSGEADLPMSKFECHPI